MADNDEVKDDTTTEAAPAPSAQGDGDPAPAGEQAKEADAPQA